MAPSHHPLDEERLRRRVTFNEIASLYDGARPDYPEALFDDVITLSGVPAGGTMLEIGSGTGKATLPLARRGFSILGIELGEQMAALARMKLEKYQEARIEVGAFEEWPLPEAAFDLAVSASAWHWIDPEIGYAKVARSLKPVGSLAVMWSSQGRADSRSNRSENGSTTSGTDDESIQFTQALQEVYRQVAPEMAGKGEERRYPGARQFVRSEALEASGYFKAPEVRNYTWETTYDTASYLRLLDSYSTHRILDPATHERLFAAIGELMETRFGGAVRRRWRAELYVARRLP
jgi:ubiquinone/menaquinone biosynthesis C-methylase UbiE